MIIASIMSRMKSPLRCFGITVATSSAGAAFAVLLALCMLSAMAAAQTQIVRETGESGLPLPRFVSLKADRVNVRRGPGFDHKIDWVFLRAGLPVEIIAEFDTWRRIRDSEGAEGWVLGSLLSGRRTGLVAPWLKGETAKTFPLRAEDEADARVLSRVGPAVLIDVMSCGGEWCDVATRGIRGWISQDALWGVYPGETIE
jgi:SH3-like domain-containing protein